MSRLISVAVLIVAAGIAACERPASPASPAAAGPSAASPRVTPVVALDAEGLRLMSADTGQSQLLAFGQPAETVHEAISLTRQDRQATQGTNPECGAGSLDYTQWDDLTLWFQNDQFVGWASNQPGLTTPSGIGVGSTQAQLQAAYDATITPSSLGMEFSAGDLFGVLKDAKVEALWAGVSCVFR